MRKLIMISLILILTLTPSIVNSQDALPFIDLKTTECVFDFDFQVYGTRFDMLSIASYTQTVKIYTSWPDRLEKSYQQEFGMGQSRYVEFYNFDKPPLYYIFETYDEDFVMTGQSYVYPKFCKQILWIPKVEGQNALE